MLTRTIELENNKKEDGLAERLLFQLQGRR